MLCNELIACANKCADRCRSSIEDADLAPFDDTPETREVRKIRSAFIHHDRRTIRERSVDHVAVACYPTNVCRAPENIVIAKIEDVLRCQMRAKQVTTCGVYNAFRFARRT